jgi:hypothetical protein
VALPRKRGRFKIATALADAIDTDGPRSSGVAPTQRSLSFIQEGRHSPLLPLSWCFAIPGRSVAW